MHIKQVVIEGFKSYKDQTIIEPFSRNINVVVGANGSGKSNFFHAIRFVLNDVASSLSQQERQKLMHEGAGHAVMSAYVEIVFDNTDQRLPFDREEVRLRRTVGKGDEYTVDKKKITKTEVINLLESAGFSRANPYYVVQQGKITKLSQIKDHERLELLKEMGGTNVYEERRRASEKLLHEAEGRRLHIADMMESMGEKLAELEAERVELDKYLQADRDRRSLQFTLWDADLNKTRGDLAKVKQQQEQEGAVTEEAEAMLQEALAEVHRLQKDLRMLAEEAAGLAAAQKTALKAKKAADKNSAAAELDLAELRNRIASSGATQDQRQEEMKEVVEEIAAKEQQLSDGRAQLKTLGGQEAALKGQLADCERRQQALHAKQGRKTQFASVAERDSYLQNEIKQLKDSLATVQGARQQVEQQAADLASEANDLASSIGDQETAIRKVEEGIKRCEQDLKGTHAQRNDLQNQRRQLFESQDAAQKRVGELQALHRQSLKARSAAIPFQAGRSLDAMDRICRDHNITGVLGPLVDLFDCAESLYSAVEVTAGGSLFHVVVDSDVTASTIMRYLIAQRVGRITCLPLNKLNPDRVTYPSKEVVGNDAIPLIQKLKYEDRLLPAMQQVFGRAMVCRDMECASRVSRQAGLNCVTMDGDEVRKKGTVAGGYRDPNRSKMQLAKGYKAVVSDLEQAQAALDDQNEQLQLLDQRITVLQGDIQKADAKKGHLKDQLQQLRSTLRIAEVRQRAVQEDVAAKEAEDARLEETEATAGSKLADMEAELGTALQSSLSPAEQKDLEALSPKLEQLQGRLADVRVKVREMDGEVGVLASSLKENLEPRQAELQESLDGLDPQADQNALAEARAAAGEAGQAVEDAAAAAERAADGLAAVAQREQKLKERLEELQAEQQDKESQVQSEATAKERLAARSVALQQRQADLEQRIRELGSLPADAYGMHTGRSATQLEKLLKKANAELKKYTHVNKKALDQWTEITEERESLTRRHAESEASHRKIKDMIMQLDMRKDELIERTFKGVAKSFKDIFAQLAPGGSGQLVMQKRLRPQEPAEDGEGEDQDQPSSSDRYSGVKVKVSFSGNEVMTMKQLSGGQKTLVALALIFAIQRCDPAPFYLFDEIDAALDPQYRETVAKMLAEQTADKDSPSQFIVTTFHPQIIRKADKIYGVSHSNRISRIDVVNEEDALAFVQAAGNDEDAAAMDES